MKNLSKTVKVFFALVCLTLLSVSDIEAQEEKVVIGSLQQYSQCNKSCNDFEKWIEQICEDEIEEHVPEVCVEWEGECAGPDDLLYRPGSMKLGGSVNGADNVRLSATMGMVDPESIGVYGQGGTGVKGVGSEYGLWGESTDGIAIVANSYNGNGLLAVATSPGKYAGQFGGNVNVSGKLLIGTTNVSCTEQDYSLAVNGRIGAKELKIENSSCYWADYVFEEDYELMPIDELDCYIDEYGHLPNIPSQEEVENNGGMDVGEMQGLLLAKVEELTLYMLELKRENEELRNLFTAR